MSTKFTAGTVINAGAVIVGVDADAPPATPSAPAPEPAPASEPQILPLSSAVSLLLDASATADGSVVDGSTNSHAITVNGDVSQSSFSPYRSGGYSLYNTGTNHIEKTGLTAPGTGDFTAEAWVYVTNSSSNQMIWDTRPTAVDNTTGINAQLRSNNVLYAGTANSALITGTTTFNDNEWVHVALVRSGGTLTLYGNGVSQGSVSHSVNLTSTDINIGSNRSGTSVFNGYIRDLRVVNDAVYTGDFTPSTSPLTSISNTVLLTCNLPYVSSDLTITGDVYTKPFSPYDYAGYSESLHGGSYVFDGNGDYLYSHDSSNAIGTQDFTLECWIYAEGNPSDQAIFESRSPGGPTDGFTLTAFSSSVIRIWCGGALVSSSGTNYVNEWTHLAVTRSSGTMTLYINGISQGSASTSFNLTNDEIIIGAGRYFDSNADPSSFFNGNIADLRIVKGTAVYTEDFTPPTAPLEAVTGTSLLLSGNNAAIRDESQSVESISVFGNTTVADSSPYGTGKSMTFDGNGDYLSVDLGDSLIDSNTPFTAEFWMYPENISNRGILHFTNNPGTLETTLYISSTGNLSWFDSRVGGSGVGDITPNSGGGITTNEWHHIALTRQSDNYVKIYVDGQLYNVSSSVWDLGLSRYLEVGRYANTAYFDGYVSDLRIIEGTAIYTENFSVPTAPLGDYSESTPEPAPEPAPAAPAELVGEPSVSSFSHIPSTRYATPGSPAVTDAATGVDVGRPDTGSSASAMIDVTVEVGVEYEFSFTATTQSGDTMFMGVIPSQGATTPEFGYVGDNALGQYPNTVHNRASVSGSGDSQTIVFTATQTDLQIVMWNSYSENLVNVQFISLKATS